MPFLVMLKTFKNKMNHGGFAIPPLLVLLCMSLLCFACGYSLRPCMVIPPPPSRPGYFGLSVFQAGNEAGTGGGIAQLFRSFL